MAGALEQLQIDAPAPVEQTNAKFHRQQDVVNYVHGNLGIPQFSRPGEAITALPRELTSMTDDQLGNLLNTLGQWVGYIDYQLAIADGQRQNAEAYLTYIQARVRIEIKHKSGERKFTNQDKSDVMETNPQVVEAKESSMFWESTYRLTKSLRDSTQLAWDTVSRRITQRGQEVDRMRRETNVAGVPAVTRSFRHPG